MSTTFDITIIREQAERRVREIELDLSDEQQMFFLASTVEKSLIESRLPIAELRELAQAHSYTYLKGNCSRAEAIEVIGLRIARDLREAQRKARTYTTTFAQMQTLGRIERQDYYLSDVKQDGENLIASLGSLAKDDLTITIFPDGETAVYEA